MKTTTTLCALVFLVGACRSSDTPALPPGPSAPVDEVALRQGTFRLPDLDRPVTLSDGAFVATDGATRVRLLQTLGGDLDGDGAADAVAFLTVSAGGSGLFHYVVPMLGRAPAAVQGRVTLLGDRVQLLALSLDARALTVELLTQGPEDPLCCPTVQVKRVYRLLGDSLAARTVTP